MSKTRLRFNPIDLIFPRRCPVCDEPLPIALYFSKRQGSAAFICPGCNGAFDFVKGPTCMKCGKELLDNETELCLDCNEKPKSFLRNIALINYDDVARKSMASFKFHGRRQLSDYYVAAFTEKYGGQLRAFAPQAIIPVPVHKTRLYDRGYNQAQELADRFGRFLGVPVRTDLLVREKKTELQKTLDAKQRTENVKNALSVKASMKPYKRVLLVDDIYTTGSTLQACTKAMAAAGAGQVLCVTICIGRDY